MSIADMICTEYEKGFRADEDLTKLRDLRKFLLTFPDNETIIDVNKGDT